MGKEWKDMDGGEEGEKGLGEEEKMGGEEVKEKAGN